MKKAIIYCPILSIFLSLIVSCNKSDFNNNLDNTSELLKYSKEKGIINSENTSGPLTPEQLNDLQTVNGCIKTFFINTSTGKTETSEEYNKCVGELDKKIYFGTGGDPDPQQKSPAGNPELPEPSFEEFIAYNDIDINAPITTQISLFEDKFYWAIYVIRNTDTDSIIRAGEKMSVLLQYVHDNNLLEHFYNTSYFDYYTNQNYKFLKMYVDNGIYLIPGTWSDAGFTL
ncbi:hypothetical protein ACR777_18070 [Sphingobacterium spiritivorum]|uniref:hypothetical protein n=1 Tax=Sphingobacterium spiritivorum TaxID=258 RepID=UPI003DA1D277